MIDLRSDTVTQPCAAMRQAMANAPVGDDVIDKDPTVERLEQLTASLLGKEAAMFMPSGTMTNQAAIKLHCQPGDEMLCEEGCHIFNYEQGAFAVLSGVIARTVSGQRSVMQPEQLDELVRPDNEHAARTRLVCLENTHNRGGGVILPYENVAAVCHWAQSRGLIRHLDGARLFNAAVATGISAQQWASHFDTVSVCFSKGLGAPVGSALAGPRDMLVPLRRHRKLFGGAMRQSGIIAAGALYALEHNIPRLAEDHATAQILATHIRATPGLTLVPEVVDTNIVIFRIDDQRLLAAEFCALAKQQGVWMLPFGKYTVRAVTHLHITSADAQRAGQLIATLAGTLRHNQNTATR
jgi:threonine aldolase